MHGCKCPNTRRIAHKNEKRRSEDKDCKCTTDCQCSPHVRQEHGRFLVAEDSAQSTNGHSGKQVISSADDSITVPLVSPQDSGDGVDIPDCYPPPRVERHLTGAATQIPTQQQNERKTISVQRPNNYDETDKPPEPSFTTVDIFFCLFSIITYLADVGSDVWVAYLYFTHKKWWYFGLTMAFIILPGVTITIFSLSWYIEDHRYNKQVKQNNGDDRKAKDTPSHAQPHTVHPVHWVSRFMLLFLQLGPVMRYIEALVYGMWSKKYEDKKNPRLRRMWYDQMLYEDTDSSLLRLIECFMESAPQLVMQLYILLTYGKQFGTDGSTMIIVGQVVSCVTALASLSWAMASYHRALRCSLEDKANMNYCGMTMQFFWRFFIVGSRVLALSLFAAQFRYYVFVVVGSHWIVMLVWILVLNTTFCKSRGKEIFFNIIMAVVYIFCYLNLVEGRTRLRYLFYYSIVYVENTAMVIFWYLFNNTSGKWYVEVAIVTILVGFFVGIAFQVLYYLLCHPNNYPPYEGKILPCISLVDISSTLCNSGDSENVRQKPKRGHSVGSDSSQLVVYSKSEGQVKTLKAAPARLEGFDEV